MDERTCPPPCGRTFKAASKKAKYCSDECRKRVKYDYMRGWRERNQEHIARWRLGYNPHPDLDRKRVRTYRARHPERATAQRDGRRRKAPFGPEAVAYREFIKGDPCAYCGGPSSSTDHIMPVAMGGLSTADNLTAACTSCNSRKADRLLLSFLLGELDRRQRLSATAA